MPTIGKAYVQIIPKTDGNLSSEVEQALGGEKIGLNTGNKIASGLSSALKVGGIAASALAAAGTAVTGMLVSQTKEVAEYGDNIDKMSQKMGLSATAYQEWDAIMQHSGTTIDAMKAPMKTLANAAQSGSDAFQKLGISEQEVATLSQEDLFSKVITGLQGMEEGTERTAIASDLLGRGATELGALLNTSAEDTEAMRQAVHDLGGVMDDEAVKASAKYQDTLQDMHTAIDGVKRGLVTDLLPGVTTVMEGLTAVFTGDSNGVAKISEGLNSIVTGISEKIPELLEVGGSIVSSLLSAIMDNLPQLITAGINLIVELGKGLLEALPQLCEQIPVIVEGLVTALTENMPTIVTAGYEILIALGKGLIQSIPVLVKSVPQIVTAIAQSIKGAVGTIAAAGKELVSGLWKGMQEKTDWLKNKIKSWVGNVVDFLKKLFGIGSPSKVMANQIGQWLPAGMGVGILDNANSLYSAVDAVSSEATNRLQIGAAVNANALYGRRSAYSSSASSDLSGIRADITALGKAINGMQVVMSEGAVVGAIATQMDMELGNRQTLHRRGVLA